MADHSLDARRTFRDQDQRLAAVAHIGNVMRPYMQFHTSIYRQWADLCELAAANYERSMEAFAGNAQQDSGNRSSSQQQG
jgi:hypothetical protein